ncbi:MAG: hypothetical protein GWO24_18205 [Akkermansiaceae bacterium]|nr:hypothetical protein [Akkermansiaceae bacterium]
MRLSAVDSPFLRSPPAVEPTIRRQAVGNSRPAEAQSIALSCDDPDAPVAPWVHGEVCNIPATASGLPEAGPN